MTKTTTTTTTPFKATTMAANAQAQGATRWLALGAIGGAILFDVAWMVMGDLRPGYSSASRPISALAIGPDGVFVRTAFLLYGALVTVGTVSALRSAKQELGAVVHWACTLMLILSPLGILWAGVFTMDAMSLHIAGAQLGCGTPIIVLPIAGLLLRRAPSWRRLGTWMLLGGPLTIALTAGFMQSVPLSAMATGGGTFGLWQRALFLEIQAWYVAISWMALREQKRTGGHARASIMHAHIDPRRALAAEKIGPARILT